jgi:hypothetical protein
MEDLFENWESCLELALMTVSDSESILGADADCREYLLDVWPQLLDLEVSDGSVPRAKFLLTEDDKYSNFNWSDSDWDVMPAFHDVSDSDEESYGEDSIHTPVIVSHGKPIFNRYKSARWLIYI